LLPQANRCTPDLLALHFRHGCWLMRGAFAGS
jgi:hypothetical protein